MLSPVSTVSTVSPATAQRDVPVVAQALAQLVATPDAAVALSLAASSEVEGKLNMLLIAARERMIDSLFAVVDAVSQSLAMQPDAGETNVGYALRLAQTINDLMPNQLAGLQQQLNAQGQTAPLALVARALQNPASNEAAQVVAYMEVVRYKEKDLATKAVVASYGQNGADEPDAAPAPQRVQQAISGNAAENTGAAPAKLPAPGTPASVAVSLPSTGEEPVSAANSAGSQAPAPLANALPVETGVASPKLSTPRAVALPAELASPSTAEVSTATVSVPPPAASAPSSPGTSNHAATASPTTVSAAKAEPSATSIAQPTEDATATLFSMPKSAPSSPPAAAGQAPGTSPPTTANTASSAGPTNTPAAMSQPQTATTPLLMQSTQPISSVAGDLLPVVAAFIEDAVQPAQIQPQSGANEAATAPQLQQKPPMAAPSLGAVVPVLNDLQGELKVVVDRLVSAIGAELLQTMAEVEPVAEKIVAQALVADMLDNAELGTLPSPEDMASPARAAAISVPPATINDNPAEELSSLIALNQMLKDATPVTLVAAMQQPLPTQFPVGVPFAVAQYLPAEDVIDDNDSLHVDRVDAVDDEEHEETGGKRGGEDEDEAAEERPESEEVTLADSEASEADYVPSSAVELKTLRPLALPRPAPMEPAFSLYQRMGGWD